MKTKREIKQTKPQIKYPRVISDDAEGTTIAYSRAAVSWIPKSPINIRINEK